MFKTGVGEAIDEGGKMQLYAEMDPSQRFGRVSSYSLFSFSYLILFFNLVSISALFSTCLHNIIGI